MGEFHEDQRGLLRVGQGDRYSRQIGFAPLGVAGQSRLRDSEVLLVGVGALGTHLADTLVRSGVGSVQLVDRDVVELNNLQRQVLFDERDASRGTPKAVAAARRLEQINSETTVGPIVAEFDAEVFARLPRRPDLILDGTDNLATRYLINDLAVRDGIPWVYGGAVGQTGIAMVVLPGRTPCLRCLWPTPPAPGELETCETAGVLAPTVALVAAIQAAEAIKLLADRREQVTRGVVTIDVWQHRSTVTLRDQAPRADCATCGTREFPALAAGPRRGAVLCGRNAVQIRPAADQSIDLDALATRLSHTADCVRTAHLLRFEVDGCRFSVFADGRALIFGVDDLDRARSLFDRYVGS